MREVINRSRALIHKKINKLKKQGVTLTHAKMQSEDSSLKGDDRTINTSRLRIKDEGQTSERGANVVETSQATTDRTISKESRSKRHKSIAYCQFIN